MYPSLHPDLASPRIAQLLEEAEHDGLASQARAARRQRRRRRSTPATTTSHPRPALPGLPDTR
jgi:hypothetical protein